MSIADAARINGGAAGNLLPEDLEVDEEMDEKGWVRRKVRRLTTKRKNGSREDSGGKEGGEAKPANGGRPWDGIGLQKGLGYFRVNLGTLG